MQIRWLALVVGILICLASCTHASELDDKVLLVMTYKRFPVLNETLQNFFVLPGSQEYNLVITQSGNLNVPSFVVSGA
jgi:hypothetical protein